MMNHAPMALAQQQQEEAFERITRRATTTLDNKPFRVRGKEQYRSSSNSSQRLDSLIPRSRAWRNAGVAMFTRSSSRRRPPRPRSHRPSGVDFQGPHQLTSRRFLSHNSLHGVHRLRHPRRSPRARWIYRSCPSSAPARYRTPCSTFVQDVWLLISYPRSSP